MAAGWRGEALEPGGVAGADGRRDHLMGVEKFVEAAVEGVGRVAEACSNDTGECARLVGYRLVDEVPGHRAELGMDVEAKAMIDESHVPRGVEQDVAALAVGVVRDEIEDNHPQELGPHGRIGVCYKAEVVALRVMVNEQLDAARPNGSVCA